MVGPTQGEWHVLRPTDGERFVVIYKGFDFSGDLLIAWIKRSTRTRWFDVWDSALCDHLSSRIRVVCVSNWSMCDVIPTQIQGWGKWTTCDRKRGCKNFFDHYNATPSLEATIAQKRSVEVGPDYFDCVCGLLALINFAWPPLTCYAIPIRFFCELPLHQMKKLRQSQAISLLE